MRALFWQLVRFCVTGSVAAAVDFGSYVTLTRLVAPLRAYYVATSLATSVAATVVAYLINGRWTFRDPRGASFGQYGQYLAVYGLGVVWQNSLLALAVELLGWPDVVAKLAAVLVVGLGWNFVLAKRWVFRYTGGVGS
jgi:putative flippase GtrA